MSLDYQETEKESTEPTEPIVPEIVGNEGAVRATPVFPIYSAILIGCLILVEIATVLTDPEHSIMSTSREAILLAGFVKQLFWDGDYWRILTGGTLHGGIVHLGFNSYALYILGKLIEYMSNRAHLAIVFLLSMVGGGILSLIFIPDVPSIGASGGVIGFLGYLTAYGFKRRKLLPASFLKNMLFNIGFIAVIGIFVLPGIDNYGHLGGLLIGLVYGFIQIPDDLHKDPRVVNNFTKNLGIASIGIFVLTSLFSILLLTGVISFNYDYLLK